MMIRDFPIVPPDSIIKTFPHLRGEDANLIISQDNDGLVADSLILRNSDWSKFLTETWLDPLYRSYNFQKAERHALVSATSSLVRTVSVAKAGRLTFDRLGTHCAMAPDNSLKDCTRSTADPGVLRARQLGLWVPGRRLCCPVCWLYPIRRIQLRGYGVTLLQKVAGTGGRIMITMKMWILETRGVVSGTASVAGVHWKILKGFGSCIVGRRLHGEYRALVL
jgi:hypothetical protein